MKTLALLLGLLLVLPTLAAHEYPPQSLYHLNAQLVDQSGRQVGLDAHSGQPVLVAMFYGSCPMTCPMLIDTLRAIERAAPASQRSNLRVLLISIDPERDTTQALQRIAQERHVDSSRWTLAHTDEATVRKVAAVLNVQYRRLPDGNYNHSNVITLLSPEGEIRRQSQVLGKADEALLQSLSAVASLSGR